MQYEKYETSNALLFVTIFWQGEFLQTGQAVNLIKQLLALFELYINLNAENFCQGMLCKQLKNKNCKHCNTTVTYLNKRLLQFN